MRESKCRSCGRTIYWGRSPGGSSIPLEFVNGAIYRVHDADKVELHDLPEGFPFDLQTITEMRAKGGALAEPTVSGWFAINHFVTCPNRDQHKK